mgnify:CR=1 FL=1
MGQINVIGLNPAGKVPNSLFNVNVGQGRVTPVSFPRYFLLVGNKPGYPTRSGKRIIQLRSWRALASISLSVRRHTAGIRG